MRRLALLILLFPLATTVRAQTPPFDASVSGTALPTAAEVRQQVADGEYRDALKSLLRILDLKGDAAASYDRNEMLLLRAECQLQIRETQAAQKTLDAAVKEARGGNGVAPNPEGLGKALALSALVAKSPRMLYTPRNRAGPLVPKPIDILDRALRPTAYKALFEDSLPEVKARSLAAQGAPNMPPILDAAREIATLRALEKAGTGDDKQSMAVAGQLVNGAVLMLGGSVAEMGAVVDAITSGANLTYNFPVQRVDAVSGQSVVDQVVRRRGLVGDDPVRLKAIQQTCAQIITACYDLHLALDAADTFQAIAGEADGLARKAGQALTDDYSRPSP